MAEVERTDVAIRYFERCKASTQARAKLGQLSILILANNLVMVINNHA